MVQTAVTIVSISNDANTSCYEAIVTFACSCGDTSVADVLHPFKGATGCHTVLVLLGVQLPTDDSQDKLRFQVGMQG